MKLLKSFILFLIIIIGYFLIRYSLAQGNKEPQPETEAVVIYYDNVKPRILLIKKRFINKYYMTDEGLIIELKEKAG